MQRLRIATQLRSGLFGVDLRARRADRRPAPRRRRAAHRRCSSSSRRRATASSSSSTTWISCAGPTGSSTWAPGPVRAADACCTAGRRRAGRGRAESVTRRVPVPASARRRRARRRRPRARRRLARAARRHAAQPARTLDVDLPLGRAHAVDRGGGFGQVDAWSAACSPSAALTDARRSSTGRAGRPEADRAHAALEPRHLHGLFDAVRAAFAATDDARARGYAPDGSRSTSPAAAARSARARGSCRSSCSSCRAAGRPAPSATAPATTPRPSRCATGTRRSPTCWR